VPWDKAALNIVSKSGGTLETLANAAMALEKLKRAAPERWRHRVVVTASPGEGRLQKWALEEGIPILDIPSGVGGRYSVLTPVGRPAAFDGIDLAALAGRERAPTTSFLQGAANRLTLALLFTHSEGKFEVDLWANSATCCLRLQQLWENPRPQAGGPGSAEGGSSSPAWGARTSTPCYSSLWTARPTGGCSCSRRMQGDLRFRHRSAPSPGCPSGP
jgi:hypothetical protein